MTGGVGWVVMAGVTAGVADGISPPVLWAPGGFWAPGVPSTSSLLELGQRSTPVCSSLQISLLARCTLFL